MIVESGNIMVQISENVFNVLKVVLEIVTGVKVVSFMFLSIEPQIDTEKSSSSSESDDDNERVSERCVLFFLKIYFILLYVLQYYI